MMKRHLVLAAAVICAGRLAQGALDLPVEESLEVMQKNAAAGDAAAQFNLAVSYAEGTKTPKDTARALDWFRKAAAAGVSEAQYDLGVILMKGVDAPKDLKEAARWFNAAATSGFFEAQTMMVRIYAAGDGLEKSPAKALAWDFLARRTLELRSGLPAGSPPKPGKLRADGAAEIIGFNGEKEWVLPDGTHEKTDAAGIRHLEHPNGSRSTVLKDGSWSTRYPNGLTEEVTAQGRRTLRNPEGQVEIFELDGTRSLEGDGTTTLGEKVRVRDTFNAAGKKTIHSVIQGDITMNERADGSRVLETQAKRNDGVAMIVSEKIGKDGTMSEGRLRRADNGEGPTNGQIWEIRRNLHLRDGVVAEVIERYEETGLFFQQEVKRVVAWHNPADNSVPATGSPPASSNPPGYVMTQGVPGMGQSMPVKEPQVVALNSSGFTQSMDDPTAFAAAPNIEPQLATLRKLEVEAQNFAGATDADFQRAQAAAASYLIPLSIAPPQKAVSAPAWLRERTITQTTMHESQLLPILDDRSKQIPFGPHGAELIKLGQWKHAETEHFIVHYRGEAEARLTVQYIEGAYTVLTQLLNLDPQRGPARSHVFVFPESEWQSYLSSHNLPPQLAGFAYKTELLLGAATDRRDRMESIKVLCHEVTHALVARFYGTRRPPLWLNEGLSEYIALRTMRTKGLFAAAKSAGAAGAKGPEELARLTGKPDASMDVERLFTRLRYGNRTTPDRMAAFYANSQKCLNTLFEKLPVEGFSKFFNTLLAGNRPDVALAVAYGKQCESVGAFQQIVNGK